MQETENEKIGNIIKELRKKNNLTQQNLADQLGVTYQAVSKWENGKNIPDIAILKEISKLYREVLYDEYTKTKDHNIIQGIETLKRSYLNFIDDIINDKDVLNIEVDKNI